MVVNVLAGFVTIGWAGPDTNISALPWKNKVTKIWEPQRVERSWKANVIASSFNSLTVLQSGSFYTMDVHTAFEAENILVRAVAAPATPVNTIPVANAGSDTTITLPTNSVVLQGTGIDAEGPVTFSWAQVTGPNSASGIPSTVAQPVAGNLIAGVYQFDLTVKDTDNATHTDRVVVTVNAVVNNNKAPVTIGLIQDISLQAGQNKIINLAPFFSDPEGATLTYSAHDLNASVGTTSINGTILTVSVSGQGQSYIRIRATDPAGVFAELAINVYGYMPEPALLYPSTIEARFNAKGATNDSNNKVTTVTSNFNGKAYTLTPRSTATAPEYVAGALMGNTLPVLRFTGNQALIGGDILDQRTEPFTMFVLVKTNAGAGYQGIAGKNSMENISGQYGIGYDVDGYRFNNASINSGAYTNTKYPRTVGNYDVITFMQNRPNSDTDFGGTNRMYINKEIVGTNYGQGMQYDMNTAFRFVVGALNGSDNNSENSFFNGDIVDVIIQKHQFADDLELFSQVEKLQSIWGFGSYFVPSGTNVGKANIDLIGDSLTNAYSAYLNEYMGATKYMPAINRGMSGYRTDQLKTLLEGWLRLDYKPETSRNICVLMMSTDNIIQNQNTIEQLSPDWVSMCATIKRRGWKLIVMIPPDAMRNTDGTSSRQGSVALKDWLLANWQTTLKADAIVSTWANPMVGGYSTQYADYWNPDTIHLSELGYRELCTTLKPVLDQVEARLSVIPSAPTNPVTDDVNNTFSVTSTHAPTNLEYTLDEGFTLNNVSALPIQIGNANKGVGGAGIRVKAINGNPPSPWCFNTVAFTGAGQPEEYVNFTDSRWTFHSAWDLGQPTYAFTGTGEYDGQKRTAKINFTKGIKVVHNSTYGVTGVKIYINGALHATVDTPANGAVLFEFMPGTDDVKTFEIGLATNQAYLTLAGATLFA